MEQKLIEKIILNLEQELLKPEIRQSREKMAEILSDDCFEFCSSGYVWFFASNTEVDNSPELNWEIVDFETKNLSPDVILATYKLIKHGEDNERKYSLRSSIWKRFDVKWKMIFHQGTITHEF
jgi:hypothetical protein